jgi:hypothetical protein
MDAASEQLQMCLEAVFSSDRVPEDMVTKVYKLSIYSNIYL